VFRPDLRGTSRRLSLTEGRESVPTLCRPVACIEGSPRNSQAHSPTPMAIPKPIPIPRTTAPTARRGAIHLPGSFGGPVDTGPGGVDGIPANSKPPSVALRQSYVVAQMWCGGRPWGRKGSPLRKAKSLPGHRLSRPQKVLRHKRGEFLPFPIPDPRKVGSASWARRPSPTPSGDARAPQAHPGGRNTRCCGHLATDVVDCCRDEHVAPARPAASPSGILTP
jgi:hypothetical protein